MPSVTARDVRDRRNAAFRIAFRIVLEDVDRNPDEYRNRNAKEQMARVGHLIAEHDIKVYQKQFGTNALQLVTPSGEFLRTRVMREVEGQKRKGMLSMPFKSSTDIFVHGSSLFLSEFLASIEYTPPAPRVPAPAAKEGQAAPSPETKTADSSPLTSLTSTSSKRAREEEPETSRKKAKLTSAESSADAAHAQDQLSQMLNKRAREQEPELSSKKAKTISAVELDETTQAEGQEGGVSPNAAIPATSKGVSDLKRSRKVEPDVSRKKAKVSSAPVASLDDAVQPEIQTSQDSVPRVASTASEPEAALRAVPDLAPVGLTNEDLPLNKTTAPSIRSSQTHTAELNKGQIAQKPTDSGPKSPWDQEIVEDAWQQAPDHSKIEMMMRGVDMEITQASCTYPKSHEPEGDFVVEQPLEGLDELYKLVFGTDETGNWRDAAFSFQKDAVTDLEILKPVIGAGVHNLVFSKSISEIVKMAGKDPGVWQSPRNAIAAIESAIGSLPRFIDGACRRQSAGHLKSLVSPIWQASRMQMHDETFQDEVLRPIAKSLAGRLAMTIRQQFVQLQGHGPKTYAQEALWTKWLVGLTKVFHKALILKGKLECAPYEYDFEWISRGRTLDLETMIPMGGIEGLSGEIEVGFATTPIVRRTEYEGDQTVASKAVGCMPKGLVHA